MLPGFRFLFAAIMLSMSLLVFGLGAAALLRAAHESFASNSSWRGAPEVTFTQRNDATLPVLATLSVEPATEKASNAAEVATAPAESTPSPADSVSHDQVAVSTPAQTPSAETTKPDNAPVDMALAQNSPAPQAAPAVAEAATAGETKTAAVTASDASSDNSEPALAQPEPAVPQATNAAAETSTPAAAPTTTPEASAASTKIATLGGPPVDIATDVPGKEKTATLEHAKDDPSTIQKRAHARRILYRRRLSARARLAVQQLQQQQANPFAQPAPAVTTRPRPASSRAGRDRRAVGLAPLRPGAVIQRGVLDAEPIERERQHAG